MLPHQDTHFSQISSKERHSHHRSRRDFLIANLPLIDPRDSETFLNIFANRIWDYNLILPWVCV
jgi:hypothetical protein